MQAIMTLLALIVSVFFFIVFVSAVYGVVRVALGGARHYDRARHWFKPKETKPSTEETNNDTVETQTNETSEGTYRSAQQRYMELFLRAAQQKGYYDKTAALIPMEKRPIIVDPILIQMLKDLQDKCHADLVWLAPAYGLSLEHLNEAVVTHQHGTHYVLATYTHRIAFHLNGR